MNRTGRAPLGFHEPVCPSEILDIAARGAVRGGVCERHCGCLSWSTHTHTLAKRLLDKSRKRPPSGIAANHKPPHRRALQVRHGAETLAMRSSIQRRAFTVPENSVQWQEVHLAVKWSVPQRRTPLPVYSRSRSQIPIGPPAALPMVIRDADRPHSFPIHPELFGAERASEPPVHSRSGHAKRKSRARKTSRARRTGEMPRTIARVAELAGEFVCTAVAVFSCL